jgi:hypothetical protein
VSAQKKGPKMMPQKATPNPTRARTWTAVEAFKVHLKSTIMAKETAKVVQVRKASAADGFL